MKKVLALLLTVALVLSFVVLPVSAAEGVTYEQTVFYQTEKPLSSLPLTLEAEIFLPAGVQSGTIFGNYTKFISVDNQSYMIYDGHPRITYTDDERFAKTLTFSGVTIPENKWVHLTMVLDLAAQKAHCYLDGVLAETLERVVLSSNVVIDNPHLLGGDLREDNDNYFRGQIKSVAVYGDARTAEEVAKDAAATTPDPDGLLAAYAPQKNYEDITDLSGNGNHLKCVRTWLPRDAAKVEDYAYSFAVICDTQYMTIRYPEKLTKLYDWIVSNAAKEKMAFAIGLGDITDASTDAEWALAKKEIHKLDKVLPYSIIRGNHDSEAGYNATFPLSDFKVDGSFDKTMQNTYQYLTVSGQKYLFMNLDYGPTPDALAWANEVTAKHPDHQVIVSTHDYMNADASLTTNGQKIWDNYVKKHDNIVLLLCGHADGSVIQNRTTYGEKGNIIPQYMINAQELDDPYKGLGMIAMLYFSADGKKVQLRYYSTDRDAYYLTQNQFSFDVAPEQIKVEVHFTDVDNHWGKDYIIPLAEQGIIKGKSATTFEPDSNITRAEFLTLALNVARIEPQRGESYNDVAMNAWFSDTIHTAKKLGLIDNNMITAEQFFPDRNITREEMTSIIVKLAESKNLPTASGDVSRFNDAASFSAWASPYIGKAVAMGVVTGNPDGTFNATGNATRAEAAVIFSRLQKLL